MTTAAARQPAPTREPWWRFSMVWLVIAGPLVVVLAGIATVVIAVQHDDPVIVEAPVPSSDQEASNAPALRVRNHAATPREP